MRLPTKKKEEAKQKNKVKSAKTEAGERWRSLLSKNYNSYEEPKVNSFEIEFNRISAGMLKSCRIKEVCLDNARVIEDITFDELLISLVDIATAGMNGKEMDIHEKMEILAGLYGINAIIESKALWEKVPSNSKVYKTNNNVYVAIKNDEVLKIEAMAILLWRSGINADRIRFKFERIDKIDETEFWMEKHDEITEEMENAALFRKMIQEEYKCGGKK